MHNQNKPIGLHKWAASTKTFEFWAIQEQYLRFYLSVINMDKLGSYANKHFDRSRYFKLQKMSLCCNKSSGCLAHLTRLLCRTDGCRHQLCSNLSCFSSFKKKKRKIRCPLLLAGGCWNLHRMSTNHKQERNETTGCVSVCRCILCLQLCKSIVGKSWMIFSMAPGGQH